MSRQLELVTPPPTADSPGFGDDWLDGRSRPCVWTDPDGTTHAGTFRWPDGVRLLDGSKPPDRERRIRPR